MEHPLTVYSLRRLLDAAHDALREGEGLHPADALDEMLKFLFVRAALEFGAAEQPRFAAGAGADAALGAYDVLLRSGLDGTGLGESGLWPDGQFHVSSGTLARLAGLFKEVSLADAEMDVKSAALREFLSPGLRKGLGIFFTPEAVARAAVAILRPRAGEKALDPACGSGTFLVEAAELMGRGGKEWEIYGCDINPRVLLMAQLALGGAKGGKFISACADFLKRGGAPFLKEGTFDVILTNPPFGVTSVPDDAERSFFTSFLNKNGLPVEGQYAELLFLEKCLRMLAPGGRLGIVLPRSILTNTRLARAREAVNRLGTVTGIVLLPPETFHITGVNATTALLFMRRFTQDENAEEKAPVVIADVGNVGYDATGRPREGGQLEALAGDFAGALNSGAAAGLCRAIPPVEKNKSLSVLARKDRKTESAASLAAGGGRTLLADITEHIGIGATPPRDGYSESGMFIVKVGNLTGSGISWLPGERNFISGASAEKRLKRPGLVLREGDILMTCAAHLPKYIAAKADIVREPPPKYGPVTFAAELALVRPDRLKVDPYVLLAWLRLAETREKIRLLVRGQTAHLYAKDLKGLEVPDGVLEPGVGLLELARLLERQAGAAAEWDRLTREEREMLGRL